MEGHVVLVTGGSRGIGLAIAQAFVSRGASAVITARSATSLEEALDSFEGARDRVLACRGDVGDDQCADETVEKAVKQFGKIDTLVNNAAATTRFGRFVNIPLSDWDKVMNVNLRAPMYWSRLIYPVMRDQGGGCVINIGSSEGLRLTGGLGCYAVSKAALQMLTRVCAREWAQEGIRVNYLSPGIIETDWSLDMVNRIRGNGQHINPMERIGTPSEVAEMAVFLASDKSGFVTGATISVDGGETA
jgi:dehydrogenase/reductase SDR family member 4